MHFFQRLTARMVSSPCFLSIDLVGISIVVGASGIQRSGSMLNELWSIYRDLGSPIPQYRYPELGRIRAISSWQILYEIGYVGNLRIITITADCFIYCIYDSSPRYWFMV
jgi:hypothetical protein